MPFEAAVEGLPTGSALLVVKRGPNAGAQFLLNRPITSAGRHSSSDIVLDDASVSGRHAEFKWQDDELRMVDVSGSNGTYVNRELAETATLANGDEICIGSFRLIVLKSRNDRGRAAKSSCPPDSN